MRTADAHMSGMCPSVYIVGRKPCKPEMYSLEENKHLWLLSLLLLWALFLLFCFVAVCLLGFFFFSRQCLAM